MPWTKVTKPLEKWIHLSVLFDYQVPVRLICRMIQINNLTYKYNRKKTLFYGLNLCLLPGKIYGLLGKNGAGKSSLIKNIAGLLLPSGGSCVVYGFDAKYRHADFLERMFFIPEECELPALFLPEFIKTYAPFYPAFNYGQFRSYLDTFNVHHDSYLQRLSFGQKKKVYIAFALATNTDLLIMDEPTNGLDIPSKLQFRSMVLSAARQDKITIMSTHQVRDLDDLISSVLILDNSQVLLQADKQEIQQRLFFTMNPGDDESPVLYSEQTPQGKVCLLKNEGAQDSYLDLEILFNATIHNPAMMKSVFSSPKIDQP